MKISDYELEMKMYGVDATDIAEILELCKHIGYDSERMDEELVKRGYEPIFGVDYDSYDDYEDDEYGEIEPFPHKRHFKDE
jgi:hypothetical protein